MTSSYAKSIIDSANLCRRCIRPYWKGHMCKIICSNCKEKHNYLVCDKPVYRTYRDNRDMYPIYPRNTVPPRFQTYNNQDNRQRSRSRQSYNQFEQRARSQSNPRSSSTNRDNSRSRPTSRNSNQMSRGRSNSNTRLTEHNTQRNASIPTPQRSIMKRSGSQTSTPNKARPKQKSFNITTPAFT